MEKIVEVFIPTEGFINIRSMRAMYPRSRTEIYRKIKKGVLPEPIEPGLWDVTEVRKALKKVTQSAHASQAHQPTTA